MQKEIIQYVYYNYYYFNLKATISLFFLRNISFPISLIHFENKIFLSLIIIDEGTFFHLYHHHHHQCHYHHCRCCYFFIIFCFRCFSYSFLFFFFFIYKIIFPHFIIIIMDVCVCIYYECNVCIYVDCDFRPLMNIYFM